ncbi:hypothetical protein [Rhodococcus aetherivorans]
MIMIPEPRLLCGNAATGHDEKVTTSDSPDLAREFLDLWADIEQYLRRKDTLPERRAVWTRSFDAGMRRHAVRVASVG